MSRSQRVPKEDLAAEQLDAPDLYIATLEGVRTPEQEIIDRQQVEGLERYLDNLPLRYALALRLRYGIRCEPHSLEQVGDKFGVTRERARQIILRGERILRGRMVKDENPKKWRELFERDKEKQRAWWARNHSPEIQNAISDAARRRQAAVSERMEQERVEDQRRYLSYQERQQHLRFDADWHDAHALNARWGDELHRRQRERNHQENTRKRALAFAQQAQALKDAALAYYNSVGKIEHLACYHIYLRHLNEWGTRYDQIWREFP